MASSRRFAFDAATSPRDSGASSRLRTGTGRLSRKHVLMLALAVEVLGVGICYADRYRPPGIIVEQPIIAGHAIA